MIILYIIEHTLYMYRTAIGRNRFPVTIYIVYYSSFSFLSEDVVVCLVFLSFWMMFLSWWW